MIEILNTQPEHIVQLAIHQRICFPTLDPAAYMREEHFAAHLRVFPEGQHVAYDTEKAMVVGQSSTFRISTERAFAQHQFIEIMGHGMFSNHDPQGEWLYGADMSVHPEYRGLKLSKRLYNARKDLIRRLNLRGMITGGQLPGYHHHREHMTVDEYVLKVQAGELIDPTLTPQVRSGFVVRGVYYNYVDDADHGAEASMIVWENPDYQASS